LTNKQKKKKKSNKGNKNIENPFGPTVGHKSESVYRSRSASLEALCDSNNRLVDPEKQNDDNECELNISFSGGYVPNTDLSRVDKGLGNP
jgi:hypothetical protein